MSNTFQLGATYKMPVAMSGLMSLLLAAEFSGEEGVFTVHKLNDGTGEAPAGSVYTDDITSKKINSRCLIPANIIEEVALVSLGAVDAKELH